jgi:hypothetical protein
MAKIIEARAVITATDAIGKTLEKIAGKFKGVTQAAKGLEKVGSTAGIDKLAAAAAKLDKVGAGKGFQANWSKGFTDQVQKMNLASRDMDRVKASWERLLSSLKSGGQIKPAQFMPALDQWEKKTLGQLQRVRREAEQTQRAFATGAASRRNLIGMSGGRFAAGALGVGSGAYVANRGLRSGIEATSTLEREGARNYLAGMTPAETTRAQAAAQEMAAKYPSLDVSQIMERIRNLRAFTGSLDKGMELLDDHLKGLVLLQSVKGRDRAMDEMQKFTKGLDILGRQDDPKSVANLTNAYVKALGVDSDLDMEQFATFARRSKAAGAPLSDEFLGAIAPTYLQDMGGPQFGTALGSELSQMISGRGTKQSKAYQEKVGLRRGKQVAGDQLLLSNPYEWARKYLPAAMKRAKLDPENDLDVAKFTSDLFSNQNVSNLFTKFLTQGSQAERNKLLYRQAPGLEAAEKLPGKDPFVAYEGLLAQTRTFIATLASPLVPQATAAMQSITHAISALTQAAAASNPKMAEATSQGAVAAGALGLGGAAAAFPAGGFWGAMATALGVPAATGGMVAWHEAGKTAKQSLIADWKEKNPGAVGLWDKEIAAGWKWMMGSSGAAPATAPSSYSAPGFDLSTDRLQPRSDFPKLDASQLTAESLQRLWTASLQSRNDRRGQSQCGRPRSKLVDQPVGDDQVDRQRHDQ